MPTLVRSSRTNGKAAAKRPRPVHAVDLYEVARVAYELFERRGRLHGYDQEDWFTAERIVAQRAVQRSAAR